MKTKLARDALNVHCQCGMLRGVGEEQSIGDKNLPNRYQTTKEEVTKQRSKQIQQGLHSWVVGRRKLCLVGAQVQKVIGWDAQLVRLSFQSCTVEEAQNWIVVIDWLPNWNNQRNRGT